MEPSRNDTPAQTATHLQDKLITAESRVRELEQERDELRERYKGDWASPADWNALVDKFNKLQAERDAATKERMETDEQKQAREKTIIKTKLEGIWND
jgi:lipase chaperone LimK